MFRALGRVLRSFIAIFTGRADRAADRIAKDPDAMRAEYDAVIRELKTNIREYMDVDASIRAERERRLAQLEALTGDITKFERAVIAAKQKLAQIKARLEGEGLDRAAIEKDPDFIKFRDAFKDYSTTLAEKKQREEELQTNIKQYTERIDRNVRRLREQQRRMEKVAQDKHEAIADVLSAQERQRLADMEAGISEDRTGERLSTLERLQREAVARADSAEAMAGTAGDRQLDELLEAVEGSEHLDDLDAELWGEDEEKKPSEAEQQLAAEVDISVPED